MIIREYVPADYEFLARLFFETIHSVNAADYSDEQLWAWAPGSRDLFTWHKSFMGHKTLVAVEDGAITGFGDIDSTGYLDRLFVRKDRQGLGIASALCSRLEEGFARVLTRSSITAKPFFLNRGYKVISEMQAVRSGISLTNFLMEKTTEHRQSDD